MSPLLLTLALVTTAPTVKVERDIVYATIDGVKLTLDLARPSTPGPHPLLVGFHGGAWKGGNKRDLSRPTISLLDFGNTGPRSLLEVMAEDGYAVASVGYRLAPEHKWPAQIIDAKTAVRFLRANAKLYDIDPTKVGAFGFSAGGHIAALLGVTDQSSGLEGELFKEQSSQVNCVVDYFGPTDMSLYAESPGLESGFMVPLLGARYAKKPEVYKEASPLYHVSKDDAPILIFHGTVDVIVPIIHSERFYDKLQEAKVPSRLVCVQGKGHGWGGQTAIDNRKETLRFFDKHLKGAK